MKILIRTDSSQKIGSGHVMRCLTLAEELRGLGAIVEFITRNHLGSISQQIKNKGFKVYLLPRPTIKQQKNLVGYEELLGVKQDIDSYETIQIIKHSETDWLIIDHYGLNYNWEEKLRSYTKKIMVIDDLANRKHDCDILLDQNYIHDKNRYDELLLPCTTKLLGVKYALLRKEFIGSKNNRIQGLAIKRIFVFFGGSDIGNLTILAIKTLAKPKLKHLLVDIVVGTANLYLSEFEKEIEKYPNIKIHIQIDNIAELMTKADLALGAGGTTTWERLVLGLPSIVVTDSDNQVAFTKDLDKDGYTKWLGNVDQVDEKVMYDALLGAINNSSQLQEQSRKCKQLVDAKGAQIVSKLLLKGPDPEMLSVRRAKFSDALLYWCWANNSVVRKNTFNKGVTECQEWFGKKLTDFNFNTALLFIESSFGPIGIVCFDRVGSHYIIDYLLAKQFCEFGLEKTMVSKAVSCMRRDNAFVMTYKAKKNHSMSKKALEYSDFKESNVLLEKRCETFLITVLSDNTTWMTLWIEQLLAEWAEDNHHISWVNDPSDIPEGDLCFFLGCSEIVGRDILNRNKNNLIVHESNLPKGKGWSPLSWQVLEGKNRVVVTLFEAEDDVDSGEIYLQDTIELQGHELVDELRKKQAEKTIDLCKEFVNEYPEVLNKSRTQKGSSTFYQRRAPVDSMLDPNKTIVEQFNLLRIVDNDRYPAYFNWLGQDYIMKIEKVL